MKRPAAVLLATVALALPASAGSIPAPVVLPRPPFAHFYKWASTSPLAAKLVKISETPNRITDIPRWFQTNDLQWPAVEADRLTRGDRGPLPPEIPWQFAGHRLIRAVMTPPLFLAIYGEDFTGGRYVVGYDASRKKFSFAFDFKNYVVPPAYVPDDREFVDEWVQWAQVTGGVLYVSNFHRTYAKSSKGLNGYITAISLARADLLWRSPPLVSNAANFVVAGNVLVTGYGFTAEPDFLYLLNRTSGAVHQTVRVRSGPESLVMKRDQVFVRTYNSDAVFRLVR